MPYYCLNVTGCPDKKLKYTAAISNTTISASTTVLKLNFMIRLARLPIGSSYIRHPASKTSDIQTVEDWPVWC
jgi:hypothetical protein